MLRHEALLVKLVCRLLGEILIIPAEGVGKY
jgi:hypothetical protein